MARLEKFNLQSLASLTMTDELDLPSLGEKKVALFAQIPDNDSSFNFIVSMLYTQLFQQLFSLTDRKYNGALPIHVHFLMDEFSNVSLPEDFEKILSVMRSREVSASITGFPDANGGQLLLTPLIGITQSCEYPDAVWEFVESYATMQNASVYLPISQSYLDSQEAWLNEMYSTEIVNQAISLVEEATTVTEDYSPIPYIVVEEAQAYFSGDKSAEDVAKIIQSRISIYLSE